MEDKKRKGKIRYLSKTPNIKSSDDEPLILTEEDSDNTPTETMNTTTADGIPIDEKDIKFRSQDIKKKDDSKLFVKVEGAERIAREKERAAKKKDEELIKRLQTAANKRKKENKAAENEKKAAKRKASRWIRNYKLKKVWKQVVRFRVPIIIVIALAIIIPTAFAINNKIQQEKEQQRIAAEKAAAERLIEENRTDMLKIYAQLAGTTKTKKEVQTIVGAYQGDIIVDFYDTTEGMILHEDGGLDFIRFDIKKTKKQTVVNNFRFSNTINEKQINIYGSAESYHYIRFGQDEEYSNVEDAINDYILDASKQS
jgi:type II secretory pathway pseudopilin PulG